MTRHLGIRYVWEDDEFGPKAIASFDNLIEEIIQMTEMHFGCPVKEKKTPAPSGMILMKSNEEEETDYTKYCSIVGKAMSDHQDYDRKIECNKTVYKKTLRTLNGNTERHLFTLLDI